MTLIRIQLVDHLTTSGEVSREGSACRSSCSYFTSGPSGLPRCTLFLTSLAPLTAPSVASPIQTSTYKACLACLTLIRSEFEAALENKAVSIVVQRNLESPAPLVNANTTAINFEVEMNTVLRGYNEFRLTLTQLEPRGTPGPTDRPESDRPVLIAPMVLDLDPEDNS